MRRMPRPTVVPRARARPSQASRGISASRVLPSAVASSARTVAPWTTTWSRRAAAWAPGAPAGSGRRSWARTKPWAGPSATPAAKVTAPAGSGWPARVARAAADLDGEAVGAAEEAVHEGRGGVGLDLGRGAALLDAAGVHHDDAVGDLERLLLVVGDEDRRHRQLLVELAEPAAEVAADGGVEGAEGLVEEEHRGLDGERPGEGDALALAAGELGGEAVAEAVELDGGEQAVDAGAALGLRRAAGAGHDAHAEVDVVARRSCGGRGRSAGRRSRCGARRRRGGWRRGRR